ncbi:hypothetical protein AALC75_09260 [Lachnospiraceae bacterium 48-42]|nr:hypothetical protein [Dorea sp.]
MVEETIKTIKETESKAEAILKEAEDRCTAILEDAESESRTMKAQAEAIAKEKARSALDSERQIGEQSIQDALAEVEGEIAVLKENARAKESEVISAVIAELV